MHDDSSTISSQVNHAFNVSMGTIDRFSALDVSCRGGAE